MSLTETHMAKWTIIIRNDYHCNIPLLSNDTIAIYSRSSIKVSQRSCTLSDDYEVGCFDIMFDSDVKVTHLILVYRSPTDKNIDAFLRDVQLNIERLNSRIHVIIARDLNIHLLAKQY